MQNWQAPPTERHEFPKEPKWRVSFLWEGCYEVVLSRESVYGEIVYDNAGRFTNHESAAVEAGRRTTTDIEIEDAAP